MIPMIWLSDLNNELASMERSRLAAFWLRYLFFVGKLGLSLWGVL